MQCWKEHVVEHAVKLLVVMEIVKYNEDLTIHIRVTAQNVLKHTMYWILVGTTILPKQNAGQGLHNEKVHRRVQS